MIRRGQNRENIAHASSLCCHGAISVAQLTPLRAQKPPITPPRLINFPNSGLQVREAMSRNSRPRAPHRRCPRKRKSRRHQVRARRCGVGCRRDRSRPTGPVRPRFLLRQAHCHGLCAYPALLNQESAHIPLPGIGRYPSATPLSCATTSQSSKLRLRSDRRCTQRLTSRRNPNCPVTKVLYRTRRMTKN